MGRDVRVQREPLGGWSVVRRWPCEGVAFTDSFILALPTSVTAEGMHELAESEAVPVWSIAAFYANRYGQPPVLAPELPGDPCGHATYQHACRYCRRAKEQRELEAARREDAAQAQARKLRQLDQLNRDIMAGRMYLGPESNPHLAKHKGEELRFKVTRVVTPSAPKGPDIVLTLGDGFGALSDLEQRELLGRALAGKLPPPPPPAALPAPPLSPDARDLVGRVAEVGRRIAMIAEEGAQPSAVAAAPAASPRGAQVYCQSQYDPDE